MNPSPVLTCTPDQIVDANGLSCPLPLLRLRQALHQVAVGQHIRLLTTDPISQTDIRRYCELSGQRLINSWQNNDATQFSFDLQKTR
jgi:tRNA 2-thiouridine synthesizing protein A